MFSTSSTWDSQTSRKPNENVNNVDFWKTTAGPQIQEQERVAGAEASERQRQVKQQEQARPPPSSPRVDVLPPHPPPPRPSRVLGVPRLMRFEARLVLVACNDISPSLLPPPSPTPPLLCFWMQSFMHRNGSGKSS
eukprot:752560-Hanusia_phi.AAC.1